MKAVKPKLPLHAFSDLREALSSCVSHEAWIDPVCRAIEQLPHPGSCCSRAISTRTPALRVMRWPTTPPPFDRVRDRSPPTRDREARVRISRCTDAPRGLWASCCGSPAGSRRRTTSIASLRGPAIRTASAPPIRPAACTRACAISRATSRSSSRRVLSNFIGGSNADLHRFTNLIFDQLLRTGALVRRVRKPAPAFAAAMSKLLAVYHQWDDEPSRSPRRLLGRQLRADFTDRRTDGDHIFADGPTRLGTNCSAIPSIDSTVFAPAGTSVTSWSCRCHRRPSCRRRVPADHRTRDWHSYTVTRTVNVAARHSFSIVFPSSNVVPAGNVTTE